MNEAQRLFWSSDWCDVCNTKVRRTLWFTDKETKKVTKKCDECLEKDENNDKE